MKEQIYDSIHTGQQIDAAISWLQIHAADQICGGAVSGTVIETPENPTYWFAPQGTYTCGSQTIIIASGNLGIISYDGMQWSSISFYVESVSIADNLTTDDAMKALSARQGYIVGSRLNTLEDKVDNSYNAGVLSRQFSIVARKVRVQAYGFALTNNVIRCTTSELLGVEDLTNAKMMVSPQGYQMGLIQAKALQSDTECLDTGWQSGSYEISGLLDDEYPYKIFNFRRADNASISQQDSETIANECRLVFEMQSAIDFIDGNGSIAKSVFNDNDTEKVEVYTKDAVDGMVGNSYTAGVSKLTFAIEVGKTRVPAYGFVLIDASNRCTISEILSVEDLTHAKRMVSPQGYQTGFVQAKALSKNADRLDTGWKGGSFVIEDVLDDEYPYKMFVFRRTDDGNVSDSDGVIIANGFYVEVEVQSAIDFIDKNGIIAKSVVNANDTEKVEVYTKDAVDELSRRAVGLVTKGDGSTTYAGAPINLSRNTFEKVGLTNLMKGVGRQGGAVYDKYFFQFYINNPYIEVYELGETRIDLAQTIMMTENVNNHANAGGFGAKYDENDPFPLLYMASSDEYKVYVYRLTGALPNLSIQLHQTITLPLATDLMYLPSIAIDAVSNELVIYGYTKDTWRDGTDNKSVVAYYDIPPTSGDQIISVGEEKARYYLPYIYAMQGACVRNGKLFLLWGNVATTQGGGVIVFYKGVIESSLDFAAVGRYEPEAVGIYDDSLYVSTQSGRMVKLVIATDLASVVESCEEAASASAASASAASASALQASAKAAEASGYVSDVTSAAEQASLSATAASASATSASGSATSASGSATSASNSATAAAASASEAASVASTTATTVATAIASGKADKTVRVDKTSDTATSFTIDAGKIYDFGERLSLEISLAAYAGDDEPMWTFTFVSGTTPTNLDIPATWEILNGSLDIEAGFTYEFNIQGNLCAYGKFKTA